MDIDGKLMEDQHYALLHLKRKLADTLAWEPADSGDEKEDEVWKQVNRLFSLLDGFFGGLG